MNKYLLLIVVLIMHQNSFAQEPISNLIIPVSYFVNHVKQLRSLKSNLIKYRQTSLVGVSGMGKTQAVRMYVYENKNNYDLIWFIDCNLDINAEFVKLAKLVNKSLKAHISEDAALAKKEIISYLSSKDKWLLVFDNLKVGENKKVQEFIDWEHNGNLIFCSQDSEILPNTIEMATFNNEDTVTLASSLLESKDKNDVEFLVQAFSGYPILIVQGAQLLNRVKGLNREEYKNKIYQSTDKIKLNVTLAIRELKPNAVKLLNKIALINNQRFSKQLLNIITDDSSTLDDNIYSLSKFMLISNVDPNEENPIFEMHDIIAQKISEINGDDNNKQYIEDTITRLMNYVPKSVVKGYVFRDAKTIHENLEIIARNSQRYNINPYKTLELNSQLIIQHINALDYYNSEKLVSWFNEKNERGTFKLWLMDNNEKRIYAGYLGLIGSYYKNRYSDYKTAIQYFIKAKEVYNDIKGFETLRFHKFYNLAIAHAALGEIQESEKNIYVLENMINSNLVDKGDISFIFLAKAKLFFTQGKYKDTLEQINNSIKHWIEQGICLNSFILTAPYFLKVEVLNVLGYYKEAYLQIKQLYEMYAASKKEDHEIFGRIYTQMARSELGLGEVDNASEHVTKAIAIFLADERRNPKEADYSEDPDLAASYVVQGDIFFVQDNFKQAIESYKKAQVIYFYLYRDRSKNVAHVSYLYTQGAKAACKAKDLYNYKTFGKRQVKEFGIDHPNTIAMFEYCKQHDMDLWAKEN